MPIPDLHTHDAEARKLVSGQIANTPATASDSVYVILPSFDPQQRWGPCPWTPHGATLPAAGASCLVAFDENDLPWIIAWA